MNKIYKVIWNKKKLCWQAVSELATQGTASGETTRSIKQVGRKVLVSVLLPTLSVLSLAVSAAIHDGALPTGANVTSGQAQFQNADQQLNIQQNTQHLSTVWNTFNIGKKAEVNFVQPNQSAIAVNRVLDTNASQIMGKLNANGQVFLINPNGIVFSKTAQVNVGGLVASTLDIEKDHQNGQMSFINHGQSGKIEQHGQITVQKGGTAALIAPHISQTGRIVAPNGEVRLTAADKVRIQLDHGQLVSYDIDQGTLQALIDQGGVIIADDGRVHLTAQAQQNLGRAVVNHSGYIQANRLSTNSKGEIVLLADMNRGTTNLAGQLFAQGENGQAGGFIETSGATVNVANSAKINTQAEHGAATGQWLIDPVDFVVGQDGNMTGAALSAALQHNDVTIQTRDTYSHVSSDPTQNTEPVGHGDILIQDAVTWESGQALTLDAYNNIFINNVIDASGGLGGKLHLKYGQQSDDGSNGLVYDPNWGMDVPTYADYFIQAPVHLQQGQNFSVQRGSNAQNLKAFQVLTDIDAVQNMKNDLAGYYALGTNIDAKSIANFASIGTMIEGSGPDAGDNPFTGLFDGLGHVIENLKITGQGYQGSYLGLFGRVEEADIRNIGLINAQIQGDMYVGGLVGAMTNSTLSNSFVTGRVEAYSYRGGAVGASYFSNIDQVYSTAENVSNNADNGLVGEVYDSKLTQSYASHDGGFDVWDADGADYRIDHNAVNQKNTFANLNWSITDRAGQAAAWRIYEGQTGPLLKAFLTPLTIKADDYERAYNGQLQNSNSYGVSVKNADQTQILGDAIYTGGSKNAGQAQSEISGLYSTQIGYDIDFVAGQVQINKAKILSIGNAVADKIYDGSLTANLTGQAQANGLFGTDEVLVSVGTASFLDKNAGENKTVVLSEVTLSGQDAANYELVNELTSEANISRREIQNITGIQAQDKTYDGTRTAQIDQSQLVLDGRIVGDDLSLAATAQFTTKHAGTHKDVVVEQLTLGGADAANYVLSDRLQQLGTRTTADIHQAEIRVIDGLKVLDKTYDATTAAVLESQNAVFDGLVQGDQVAVGGTASFADKHAGKNKAVDLQTLALTGDDASNYRLVTQPYQLTANIGKATLSLSDLLATSKVYDGTLDTHVDLWRMQIDGRLGNDLVNVTGGKAQFADKNAGQNKTVYISDLVLTGADAGNYQLAQTPLTTTANIDQRVISDMSGFGQIVKTYDGKLSAPLSSQYAQTYEALTGDNVLLYATDASFGDKNVGLNKVVRLHGLGLIGADAANYKLATNAQWYQGSINKAFIADIQGLVAQNKIYDGTTDVQVNKDQLKLVGTVLGDQLTLDIGQAQFLSKNAGQNRLVNVSGLTLNGQDAQNYELLPTSLNLQANIAKATISDISGLIVRDKVYDSSLNADIDTAQAVLTGKIAGDDLGIFANGRFVDKNVGTDKQVVLGNVEFSGIDGLNYELDLLHSPSLTANITQAQITQLNGIQANNKIYDGNTHAQFKTDTAQFIGMFAGDDLSVDLEGHFSDKNAGTDKTVRILNAYLSGVDGQNYRLADGALQAPYVADIHRAKISDITGLNADKVYDATLMANVDTRNAILAGQISGDELNLSVDAVFNDKNAGVNKQLKVLDIQLSGKDSQNYDLTTELLQNLQLSAAIEKAKITAIENVIPLDKNYDGKRDASLDMSQMHLQGVYAGDDVGAELIAMFAMSGRGLDIPVYIQNILLKGADKNNYELNIPATLGYANIVDNSADPLIMYLNQIPDEMSRYISKSMGSFTSSYEVNIFNQIDFSTLSFYVDANNQLILDPQAPQNQKLLEALRNLERSSQIFWTTPEFMRQFFQADRLTTEDLVFMKLNLSLHLQKLYMRGLEYEQMMNSMMKSMMKSMMNYQNQMNSLYSTLAGLSDLMNSVNQAITNIIGGQTQNSMPNSIGQTSHAPQAMQRSNIDSSAPVSDNTAAVPTSTGNTGAPAQQLHQQPDQPQNQNNNSTLSNPSQDSSAPNSDALSEAEQATLNRLIDTGILSGEPPASDGKWTRQDLAVIMARLAGHQANASGNTGEHGFSDTQSSSFYDGYINWSNGPAIDQFLRESGTAPTSSTPAIQNSGNASGAASSTNGGNSDLSANPINEAIHKFYMAYFGRPADEAGLAYWSTQLSSGTIGEPNINGSTQSLTASEIVDRLYQQILNRSTEGDGLAYWVSALSDNTMSSQAVMDAIRAHVGGTSTPPEGSTNEQFSANPVSSDSVPQAILDFITDVSNSSTGTNRPSAEVKRQALEKLRQDNLAK